MKIIETAIAEIGTKENPPNSNLTKYGEWFGLNGQAWCGQFVSWVFFHAGFPLPSIDFTKGYAGCPYAVTNVNKWGKIVTIPQSGDVVFYDWQGDGKWDHTGIFVKDLGKGYFQAIEGNTALTNQSDGGEVMLRSDRKYKNVIFIRPNVLNAHL
jgi:hypothetical protein